MPKFRIIEVETATYQYIVEAATEDEALEMDYRDPPGKWIDAECEFIRIEKVEE